MDEPPPSFGVWLKAARGDASVSARALAEAASVRFTFVSQIENGQRGVPFIVAMRFAAFLGYDAWSVIDEFDLLPRDVQDVLIRSARQGPASLLPLD